MPKVIVVNDDGSLAWMQYPPPVVPPVVPPIPPVSVSGMVGPGVGYDTKANINIGPDGQKVSIRFKATQSAVVQSVRFVARGGPVYSYGNGGTTHVSLQADDGSGHPSGTSLASGSVTTGNPPSGSSASAWETYPAVSLSPGVPLTAGQKYHIVFTNPDAGNNISINFVYLFNNTTPRQPRWPDADLAVLYTTGSWGADAAGYLPVVDVAYANGTHDGNAYYESMIDLYRGIGGSNMVRQVLTGAGQTVNHAAMRVRRGSGSSPLVLSLVNAGGTVIDSTSVSASGIPISSPGGDNGGSVWAVGALASSHVLTSGATYYLQASAASGTTYTSHPIRAGGSDGSLQSFAYSGGVGQYTTNGGSSWSLLYSYSKADAQAYLV